MSIQQIREKTREKMKKIALLLKNARYNDDINIYKNVCTLEDNTMEPYEITDENTMTYAEYLDLLFGEHNKTLS